MVCNLVVGIVFSAVFLFYVGYYALMLLYLSLGIDLCDFKSDATVEWPSLGEIIGGIIVFIVWLCAFAYLGPHSLIRFKRRLSSRLHVLSGRPLASVEGKATLDPSSESGYIGIEIGEFYFNFDDCWLNVDHDDLGKLERAGGWMRIWYIPTATQAWNNPNTGKLMKYDSMLVRAEWRPAP